VIQQAELELKKWYSHVSIVFSLTVLEVMRLVFPHKEATSSFVMLGLMSETRRGWHEEKTRIRTAKRNRQMILFLSISFYLLSLSSNSSVYSSQAPSAEIFFSIMFIMGPPVPSQKRPCEKLPYIIIIALSSHFGKTAPGVHFHGLLKNSYFAGWSKMPGCKAPEILRSEAYLSVRRNDEG
jgi:hypothetical protein